MPQSKQPLAAPRQRRVFRRLSQIDVARILQMIEEWPLPSITWDALVRELEIRLGCTWTRQSLEKHEQIKEAYQARKAGKRKSKEEDPQEQTAHRLRSEIAELKATLDRYHERFAVMVYNATRRFKVPSEELERPLPPMNRGD